MKPSPNWGDALENLMSVIEELSERLAGPGAPPEAGVLFRRLSSLARFSEPNPAALFPLADACTAALTLVGEARLALDIFPRLAALHNLLFRREPDLAPLKKLDKISGAPAAPFRVSRVATGGPRVRMPAGTLPCTRAHRSQPSLESVSVPALTTQPLPHLDLELRRKLEANDNREAPGPAAAEDDLLLERAVGVHGFWEEEFQARTAWKCSDDFLMLGRHRMERRLAEASTEEGHILRAGDALCLTGSGVLRSLAKFWAAHREMSDPYRCWGLAYACATFAGSEPFALLGHALSELPPRSPAEVERVAEALRLVERPELGALAEQWLGASHPVLRAVAIELKGRSGQFGSAEAPRWLRDPNLGVIEAGLNALARSSELSSAARDLVERWMDIPDPEIAWAASRCLLFHGNPRPHFRLTEDPEFERILGPRALELLILCGTEKDRDQALRLATSHEPTPAHLDRIARFGLGECHPILVAALGSDFPDAAADALEVICGPHPEPAARLDPDAWNSWISELQIEPGRRYRLGELWEASSLARELECGELSRRGLALRLDEFQVRLGRRVTVDVNAWAPHLENELAAALPLLEAPHKRIRPGSFGCAHRA